MSIVACPQCGTDLEVSAKVAAAGRVACPECDHAFDPRRVARPAKAARAAPPTEPKKKSRSSPLGCLLLVLVVGGAWGFWHEARQKKALEDIAAGDQAYTAGKKADAVAKYKSGYAMAPLDRRPELLQRIVDFEAAEGTPAEARKWVEQGIDGRVGVTYQTPAAQGLLAQVQRERAEAEARKKADREAKEKAAREAEAKRERYGGTSEATTAAQNFVKRQLAFPAEARFAVMGRDTTQQADGSWQVSGEVTSKNAFGVRVKFRFRSVVLKLENGDWREVETALAEAE